LFHCFRITSSLFFINISKIIYFNISLMNVLFLQPYGL
jgi:hypothetical protein